MVLEVVVELVVQEEEAKTTVQGELVGRACHSHPLTPQLCLQWGVEATDSLQVVQVLLMAQGLGAQAISIMAPYPMLQRELTTEAMEAEAQTRLAMAVLGAQALSSSATEI
jgi:hypothetical protein